MAPKKSQIRLLVHPHLHGGGLESQSVSVRNAVEERERIWDLTSSEPSYLNERRKSISFNVYTNGTYPKNKNMKNLFMANQKQQTWMLKWLKVELRAILLHFDSLSCPLYLSLSLAMLSSGISSEQVRSLLSDYLGSRVADYFQTAFERFCAFELLHQEYDEVVPRVWKKSPMHVGVKRNTGYGIPRAGDANSGANHATAPCVDCGVYTRTFTNCKRRRNLGIYVEHQSSSTSGFNGEMFTGSGEDANMICEFPSLLNNFGNKSGKLSKQRCCRAKSKRRIPKTAARRNKVMPVVGNVRRSIRRRTNNCLSSTDNVQHQSINATSNSEFNGGHFCKAGDNNGAIASVVNCGIDTKTVKLAKQIHSYAKNKRKRILLEPIPKTAARGNKGMPIVRNIRRSIRLQSKKCLSSTAIV